MKEERYFYAPDAVNSTQLPNEEAVHAARVLRIKEGDTMYLMDGQGSFYKAEATLVTQKRCDYTILEAMPQERLWPCRIHIAMAPTKNIDRVEWMAEKATEIGFDELSFLECQFSERRQLRTDRIDKIVIAATKQSRKAWKPQVNDIKKFHDFITTPRHGRKFICHCYEEVAKADLFNVLTTAMSTSKEVDIADSSNEDITILIGPEGDFSINEVQQAIEHGYESVSLGSSRLRTETAALSAVMIAQLCQKQI